MNIRYKNAHGVIRVYLHDISWTINHTKCGQVQDHGNPGPSKKK